MDDALRSVNLLSVGNELVGGYRCVRDVSRQLLLISIKADGPIGSLAQLGGHGVGAVRLTRCSLLRGHTAVAFLSPM